MHGENHGLRWSGEADQMLRELSEHGLFLPAIARALGRAQESVRTRANILGIPVRSSARRSKPINNRPTTGRSTASTQVEAE